MCYIFAFIRFLIFNVLIILYMFMTHCGQIQLSTLFYPYPTPMPCSLTMFPSDLSVSALFLFLLCYPTWYNQAHFCEMGVKLSTEA